MQIPQLLPQVDINEEGGNSCHNPCEGTFSRNGAKFVGSGRGGYQVVEKLVWVGEGQGSFNADEAEAKSRRMKEYAVMAVYQCLLCMILLCLLLGMALMVPQVRSVLNAALPLQRLRGPGRHDQQTGVTSLATAQGQAAYSTTAMPAGSQSSAAFGCSASCTLNGVQQACDQRIRVASVQSFSARQDACSAAYSHVRLACSECAFCSLAQSGCQDSAAIAPATAAPQPSTIVGEVDPPTAAPVAQTTAATAAQTPAASTSTVPALTTLPAAPAMIWRN